ncbi:MAG: hypothetical protein ACK6A7_06040, partial [Planctomycetota bacterium]
MQMLSSLRSLVQVSWVIVACCSAPCVALADPPFSKLFRKTGSVQLQVSELKPEHGPWLIFAASCEGPLATLNADALAPDLQQDRGLRACIVT